VQLDVDIRSKSFENVAGKRHDVLDGITFTLNAGEVGVVFGPSGCGKSTLLRILAGLDRDYQGQVTRPAGARLGMVFQEPRLLPWRSVEENVRLVAPHIDDIRLFALFEVLELSAHRSHFPGELSLGLARRVALARAFAVEPDFLILDEALASLDNALAGRLRDQIATLVASRLRRRGRCEASRRSTQSRRVSRSWTLQICETRSSLQKIQGGFRCRVCRSLWVSHCSCCRARCSRRPRARAFACGI
jgi:NitT/TauT family transport system ATP-binding protein